MKFKMNDLEWEIIEVPPNDLGGSEKYVNKAGETHFGLQEIWLLDIMGKEHKRKVLLHELMHVYIYSYITSYNMDFNEELLCDISGNSHDIIHKIAEDYFKNKKDTD